MRSRRSSQLLLGERRGAASGVGFFAHPAAPSRSAERPLADGAGSGSVQAPSRLGQRCCSTAVSDTGGSCRRAVFRSARANAAVSAGAATALLLVLGGGEAGDELDGVCSCVELPTREQVAYHLC